MGAAGLKYLFLSEVHSFLSFSVSSGVRLGLFVGLALPLCALGQSLRTTVARLEQAVRSREDVLAVVSHDLRTPLAAIRLNTSLLSRTLCGDESDPTRKALGRLEQSAASMQRLIKDLLDFASIESGRLEIHPAQWSVEEVLGVAWEPAAARADLHRWISQGEFGGLSEPFQYHLSPEAYAELADELADSFKRRATSRRAATDSTHAALARRLATRRRTPRRVAW